MAKIKYKCPLCQRSAVIKTSCPICARMMLEVCAGCERPVNSCICGTELTAPQIEPELPEERQIVVYKCHGCLAESAYPDDCYECNQEMEKMIICKICGKTVEGCRCDENGFVEEEAEEAEGEKGEETNGVDEEIEMSSKTEED